MKEEEMKITLDTYIISDTHFGHDNIIKYCNRPKNHDSLMSSNWISIVDKNDDILHLGDLVFRGARYLSGLTGNKYLMIGNHDHRKPEWYKEHGFTVVSKRMFFNHDGKIVLFTHYPEERFDINWDINIHGHIHNNGWTVVYENNRKFINVSVEVMNYTPVKLGDILNV